MTRGYNFGAGPAMLPEGVLQDVQHELLNWQNLDMSILEVGHRTTPFLDLMAQAEADLRDILSIPSHYHVLFLSGAARTQFAMIPLNLICASQQAGYLISGLWSKMAYEEAVKLANAYCVASSESTYFLSQPNFDRTTLSENTAYLYYTPNETVNGIRFAGIPQSGDVPLVADMTSCLLSEPLDVNRFGLIFAGAQKNIAPSGLTIVIIRADLLSRLPSTVLPTMLDYRTHVAAHSLYATPATFQCYMAAKMFQWVKMQGGIDVLYQQNCQKAALLYDYIDASEAYQCLVAHEARSLMNVCFSLTNPAREKAFLYGALARKLYALQGHRVVGGLRASLYNAMPLEGVQALIAYMQDFAANG
jgi:phosphoserine aminotransferase